MRYDLLAAVLGMRCYVLGKQGESAEKVVCVNGQCSRWQMWQVKTPGI